MNPFALIGSIFNTFFFVPIVNAMVLLIHGFDFIRIPGSLGLSIVAITVAIRFLVWPFMSAQLKSTRKMSDLKPHLDKLKQKHKNDQKEFAKAQMALFKEHGVNPAAGCLPAVIQIPVLLALYRAIFAIFDSKAGLSAINNILYPFVPGLQKMPDPNFFGLNLSHKPSDFGQYGLILLAIPVITGILQLIQSKMMAPKPVKLYPEDTPKEKKEKASTGDAMGAMQSQMIYMMPLMVAFFSWQFPVGLALYWNTNTVFGIIQQYKIMGLGGLTSWKEKLKL